MTELSPEAQAVRDAVLATYDDSIPKDDHLWALDRASVVASLRALVGANAYEAEGDGWYSLVIDVDDIYAIADELENQ